MLNTFKPTIKAIPYNYMYIKVRVSCSFWTIFKTMPASTTNTAKHNRTRVYCKMVKIEITTRIWLIALHSTDSN